MGAKTYYIIWSMNAHPLHQTALQSAKPINSNAGGSGRSSSSGESEGEGSVLPKRLQTVQRLNNSIDTNAYGMPRVIYKADQIPADYFERPPKEQQQLLELASVEVVNSEGLPVIPDHGLLWEQLPWEPADAYLAFSNYVKLHETHGYRALNLLLQDHPTSHLSQERLTDPDVRKERQEYMALMREYHVFYCWSLRARAFDMLAQAAYERLRERRALQTENYHFLQTDNIIKKLVSRMDEVLNNSDKWEELSIPEFIKSMKTVMELQRVAVGLPAAAPMSVAEQNHPDSPHGHSLETRLKLQAKRQAAVEDPDTNSDKAVETVLEDPQLLAMAQELIAQTMLKRRAESKPAETQPESPTQTNRPMRNADEESPVEALPPPKEATSPKVEEV